MTAADVVAKALQDEQDELVRLPFARPSSDYFKDFYGGRIVLDRCSGSGELPKVPTHARGQAACSYCYLPATDVLVKDGVMVEHAKALPEHEQVERLIGVACATLGFDEWSDVGSYARAAARDASARRLGFVGQLARGVAYLAEQLVRRDATQGAQDALAELLEFTMERDEHPLFTEAGLYDRLGKDQARSVLSRLRDLTAAMGGDT